MIGCRMMAGVVNTRSARTVVRAAWWMAAMFPERCAIQKWNAVPIPVPKRMVEPRMWRTFTVR